MEQERKEKILLSSDYQERENKVLRDNKLSR